MANETEVREIPASPTVKVPMLPLLLCCLLAVLLAVGGSGGVLFYMAKHGKLGVAPVAAAEQETKKAPIEEQTHPVVLEPIIANLSDPDGHSFLRVSIVLAEADPPGTKKSEKEEKPKAGADAAVRDVIIAVLGKQKVADLLAEDGKEKLKDALKKAVAEGAPEAAVRSIYFTDFLVQR